MNSGVDIPQNIKTNVRAVLLSKVGGIYLDHFLEEYHNLVNKPLLYQRFGFNNIEAFIRSIPDAARMEYSVKDNRMKVFGVPLPNPFMRGAVANTPGPVPRPYMGRFEGMPGRPWADGPRPGRPWTDSPRAGSPRPGGPRAGSPRPGGPWGEGPRPGGPWDEGPGPHRPWGSGLVDMPRMGPGPGPGPGFGHNVFTGEELELEPDHRGVYSLCFPACNRPDVVGTLRDMFSLAGKVFEVNETPRWIFVRYYNPQSVHRAFRMFAHLGLRLATLNPNIAERVPPDMQEKRVKSSGASEHSDGPKKPKKRKKKTHKDGPSYRVYCGNLDPAVKYTFDMFRNLFKNYPIGWVTIKTGKPREGEAPKLFGYLLLKNRENAERLCKEYNGYVWMGRKLVLEVKEKQTDLAKRMASSGNDTDSSVPDLQEGHGDMPGLESDSDNDMPGLESVMPGLEPDMPGLEPVMPGLEPTMPGLESVPSLRDIPIQLNADHSQPKDAPTILVTNFRDDVSEQGLMAFFVEYHPRNIRLAPTLNGRKKAYIELGSVEDVRKAVRTLNQTMFQGLKLKVDVPFNMPKLREAVLGCDRVPAATGGAITLSEILKMRGSCLQILQTPEISLNLGQQIEVLVTTVISDNFFWGQIVDMRSMQQLRKISDRLNKPRENLEVANGPGRCMAIFQGDGNWYRAWVMHSSHPSDLVRVFYLDYGNTAAIPWSHSAKASEHWLWELQPMAVPFTLTEPVNNLKSRELSHLMVEVNALGSQDEGNMVVVKVTSLVPNLKETVASIGQTIIM